MAATCLAFSATARSFTCAVVRTITTPSFSAAMRIASAFSSIGITTGMAPASWQAMNGHREFNKVGQQDQDMVAALETKGGQLRREEMGTGLRVSRLQAPWLRAVPAFALRTIRPEQTARPLPNLTLQQARQRCVAPGRLERGFIMSVHALAPADSILIVLLSSLCRRVY